MPPKAKKNVSGEKPVKASRAKFDRPGLMLQKGRKQYVANKEISEKHPSGLGKADIEDPIFRMDEESHFKKPLPVYTDEINTAAVDTAPEALTAIRYFTPQYTKNKRLKLANLNSYEKSVFKKKHENQSDQMKFAGKVKKLRKAGNTEDEIKTYRDNVSYYYNAPKYPWETGSGSKAKDTDEGSEY